MNNISEDSPLAISMAPFAVTLSLVVAMMCIIATESFSFANKTELHPMLGPISKSFRHMLETIMKENQQPERAQSNLECDSNNNPDRPSSSSKSRVLKRFFSLFQRKCYQSRAMIAADLTSAKFSAFGSKHRC